MEHLEQESKELNDEITRLTTLMESVIVAQNQPSLPPATPPPRRTVISEIVSSTVPITAAIHPVMSVPHPIIHTLPRVEETIYYSESSEDPDVYEKMDKMKDQFLELRKELKTLRGNDLFGKSVACSGKFMIIKLWIS
ncbi:hypothetical protein KIW84_051888 [Lathyrus oleraceus]|uniref:Uncharacterized protein n=1 Tax=Pisum sativum TaxID=3888 RepID=A0A9D5AB92_PEA|nr:hypothetical protein KIW84_051888 [Pisum sativum]